MAKLTDEEKNARDLAKVEKARLRAEKKTEREANKPPKHQAKLDRARSQLPELNEAEQYFFDKLVGELPPGQLEKVSAHLAFHVRQTQTANAVETTLTVGQTVRIVSGNQKHLGKVGVVSRAQRIRCYVNVPNVDREIYLFTSDVEPIANDVAESVDLTPEVESQVSVAV